MLRVHTEQTIRFFEDDPSLSRHSRCPEETEARKLFFWEEEREIVSNDPIGLRNNCAKGRGRVAAVG